MKHLTPGVALLIALCCGMGAVRALPAQTANPAVTKSADKQDELKFVVIVSRHGVRSPTGKLDQLNQYSRQPWPTWSVPAGYLTEHGAKLMTLFGSYDRALLASQGLLSPAGCADADHIRIVADSDQRTRETGIALAAGLAPGCSIAVKALPEGTNDPIFHAQGAGVGHLDKALVTVAISGRVGTDPQGISEAYHPQLWALEDVLLGCNPGAVCKRTDGSVPQSLFDQFSSNAQVTNEHSTESHSSLNTASTMAENILLEYTEGMDATQVGWGRVDLQKLRDLMQLHTAHEDIGLRTAPMARAQASNLLSHVLRSMQQVVGTHPVAGSLSKPDDRLLILVGHDTNIAAMAGALNLNWLVDGRRDDTPPGGALVFELWKQPGSGQYSVRTFYTAQTLDQMRNSAPLSLSNPPERVAVYMPGCNRTDSSCTWDEFQQAVQSGIDPRFVRE